MKRELLISVAAAVLLSTMPAMSAGSAGQTVQLAQATTTAEETKAEKRQRLRAERRAKRQADRRKKRQEEQAAKKAERIKKRQEGEAQQTEEPKPKRKNVEADEAPKSQDQRNANNTEDGEAENAPQENAAEAVTENNRTAAQKKRARVREQRRRDRKRRDRRKVLGAFAAGAVVGTVINELGGKVVEDQGDRIVVERNGRYVVRRDDNDLFRRNGVKVFTKEMPNRNSRTVAVRPNGVRIVSIRDPRGTLIRRVRENPGGNRIVLFDDRETDVFVTRDYRKELGTLRLDISQDDYIVEAGRADRRALRRALAAQPVEKVERKYSLNEVRNSYRLRQKTRRIDLDTITFATGEFALNRGQVDRMSDVAGAMNDIIQENPREIFLVEGHTDAVGSEISNLTLSDRRAESVARILTEFFKVPPENLVVQGYGETNLKIETLSDERKNRRATVRRITPLIQAARN